MMQILTLVFWLAFGAAQQTANGSVEGTVLRAGTTDPIERVQVTLTRGAPASPMTALTDKEGHFSFPGVEPGRYTIRIERDGYLVPGSTRPITSMTINVGPSEQVKGLTYYLVPGGTISGRILDPVGRLSALATVTALRLSYPAGWPVLEAVKTTTSNDRGEYRMFWLEPGDYIVRAEKLLPTGPARAYYPGLSDAANSVKVRVSGGAESPKIDISIRKDETFRISGTVTNIVAGPAPPATARNPVVAGEPPDREVPQFYLSPVDPDEIFDGAWSATNALTSAQDRAAGKFEIRNVRPGYYNLISVVTDRISTPPRYFVGRTPVEVSFEDVSDLKLLIAPGRDFRGRIIYSGKVSPPASVRVQLQPKGILPALPLAPSLSAVAEADGTFTILNVPDLPYSISLSGLPRDAYVADLRQGSFSVFDVGMVVPGRRVNDEFEVIVDSPGANLSGKVTTADAQIAAGATVALVPDERRQENLLLYRRTNASEAGVFSFTGVAPGRYSLFAWESLPVGAEYNPEFRDAFRDDAREISVAPGDTTVVGLRLIER